jgi:hypothetical protein
MRHTGNFNLEWGYLAPAPSFLRSVRLVVVAATIAATASAAVVLALVRQPAAETSIAARTLVQPIGVASARRVPMATAPQTQSEHASTPDVQHAAGPTRRDGAPALAQAPINSSAAGSGIASGSATSRAPIATAGARRARKRFTSSSGSRACAKDAEQEGPCGSAGEGSSRVRFAVARRVGAARQIAIAAGRAQRRT